MTAADDVEMDDVEHSLVWEGFLSPVDMIDETMVELIVGSDEDEVSSPFIPRIRGGGSDSESENDDGNEAFQDSWGTAQAPDGGWPAYIADREARGVVGWGIPDPRSSAGWGIPDPRPLNGWGNPVPPGSPVPPVPMCSIPTCNSHSSPVCTATVDKWKGFVAKYPENQV